MNVLEIEKEILSLDLENQLYLANSLFSHIEKISDIDFEDEWNDLAESRLQEYEEGIANLTDSEVVLKMMKENY
jgi:hypothetical protein